MVLPTQLHAILLASPGKGHLIPVIELANRLISNHNFQVTIFVMTMEPITDKSSLVPKDSNTKKASFELVVLPYIDPSDQMRPNDTIMTRIAIMMRAYIPSLQAELRSMEHKPNLLIVDLFGTEFIKLADEFNMMKYVFIASNALFLAETVNMPLLDRNVKQEGPLNIPGCTPIKYDDILDPASDPNRRDFDEYLRIGVEIAQADGVLVNTWEELEPKTLNALRNNKVLKEVFNKPVYPIGPVIRPVKPEGLGEELKAWLDDQPKESVLYVSFGSGGTLSTQQTHELAWGLELSQQRFIWVFRPPTERNGAGVLFHSNDGEGGVSRYLPDGFLTRTKNLGVVVPMWASQFEILAHTSVGGFMSHCGWNSAVESLVNGVPIIAWPLYAEQNMNATLLEAEIGVAVRSNVLPRKGVIFREEIDKMVRKIMVDKDGLKIREKVKQVQEYAKRAITVNGSSSNSLSRVAHDCEVFFMSQAMAGNGVN